MMFEFLLFLGIGLLGLVLGAYFHGPVLNACGAVADWIKAKMSKKP